MTVAQMPPGVSGGGTALRFHRPTRGRLLAILALLVGLSLWFDASRPPPEQFFVRSSVVAIHVYQRTGSPLLARAGYRCRFEPTCSHYGEQALQKFGFLRGVAKTAARIARCGPGTPMGTIDVP